MEEVYKVIEGFENYAVSNTGNVKNIKTGRILKDRMNRGEGHYQVALIEDRKKKTLKVHRLVAQAFIKNPENKTCVDHIDRNIKNNNVDNLRWASHSENSMNRSKSRKNTSGYTGIVFNNKNNKWYVQLMAKGQNYFKSFKTIEEAIEYRAELEKIHFGIYAPQPIININITNNIQTLNTLNQGQNK